MGPGALSFLHYSYIFKQESLNFKGFGCLCYDIFNLLKAGASLEK